MTDSNDFMISSVGTKKIDATNTDIANFVRENDSTHRIVNYPDALLLFNEIHLRNEYSYVDFVVLNKNKQVILGIDLIYYLVVNEELDIKRTVVIDEPIKTGEAKTFMDVIDEVRVKGNDKKMSTQNLHVLKFDIFY